MDTNFLPVKDCSQLLENSEKLWLKIWKMWVDEWLIYLVTQLITFTTVFFSRNSLIKFYWAASWFWAVCRLVDTQTRAQASAQAQYPNPHIHPLTQAVTQARVPLLLMSCSPAAEDITAVRREKNMILVCSIVVGYTQPFRITFPHTNMAENSKDQPGIPYPEI